ncbi:MAG: DUF2726 domain-containing protein [Rubrivivax sp.]|nr:DUF2726 domain-containing protein [Rubrivivax sp.]
MNASPVLAAAAALFTLGLLFTVWRLLRRRGRSGRSARSWLHRWRPGRRREALDTVAGWQPELVRVLNVPELAALELARRAAPEALLLSQVPLSRFLRVHTRNSYSRWLARVGHMNADLVICDGRSRVLAVVDVRARQASERSQRRHDRLLRVLRAAGVQVLIWHEDQMPSVGAARAQLSSAGVPMGTSSVQVQQAVSPPTLQPRDLVDLLAEGDARVARRAKEEALPSDFGLLQTRPAPMR